MPQGSSVQGREEAQVVMSGSGGPFLALLTAEGEGWLPLSPAGNEWEQGAPAGLGV